MNTATDPQAFHGRPRFILVSNQSMNAICDQFKNELESVDAKYDGKVRAGYISIYPKSEHRHYWSPHLSISLEPLESDLSKTNISGLYGPAPEVWTMFVFFYAIIGLSLVITTVIGFANRSVEESSAILWAIPLLILALASMYAVSYFGQKKGHDQVKGMYKFMESIVVKGQ